MNSCPIEQSIEAPSVNNHVANFFKNLKVNSNSQSVYAISETNHFYKFCSKLQQDFCLKFTNQIYEYHPLRHSHEQFILSCHDDPIRVFAGQKTIHMIPIKKQNSEDFLAPLNISQSGNLVLFGGKRLLRIYDLEQMCFTNDFAKSSQWIKKLAKQIASCAFLSEDLFAVGFFNRQLAVCDKRTNEAPIFQNSIHFDAVLSIVAKNQFQFFSSARNDEFVYLWVRLKRHEKTRRGIFELLPATLRNKPTPPVLSFWE